MKLLNSGSIAKPYLIAEIGNNHEGDVGVALELVREASTAGADAIKLQVFTPSLYVRESETERMRQLERFRLTADDVRGVHDAAKTAGLDFVCTPFDIPCVEWLSPLVDAFKIASGDNDFAELLDRVAVSGKPVIALAATVVAVPTPRHVRAMMSS